MKLNFCPPSRLVLVIHLKYAYRVLKEAGSLSFAQNSGSERTFMEHEKGLQKLNNKGRCTTSSIANATDSILPILLLQYLQVITFSLAESKRNIQYYVDHT